MKLLRRLAKEWARFSTAGDNQFFSHNSSSGMLTHTPARERLTEAGLVDIKVIPDSANIFPTFVGCKSK